MKWENDLVKDIRTFTEYDDYDWDELAVCNHYNDRPRSIEVSDCNRYCLLKEFLKVRDDAKSILEIGIGRNSERSFSYVLIDNKKKDTTYIGLDIEDRTFLNNKENNVHTMICDSSNYYQNIFEFRKLGVKKFDFIFIDGWHSINQVLRDWEYTNLLSTGGIVGFHDTSCHPGPYNFIRSLNKDYWEVTENCCPDDWGIGFARKI